MRRLRLNRHEDTGDAPARHSTHAGQRASAVLLRLLHIRHRRRAAVGGHPAPAVLPQGSTKREIPGVSRQRCKRHPLSFLRSVLFFVLLLPALYVTTFLRQRVHLVRFIITLNLHRVCILLFLTRLLARCTQSPARR